MNTDSVMVFNMWIIRHFKKKNWHNPSQKITIHFLIQNVAVYTRSTFHACGTVRTIPYHSWVFLGHVETFFRVARGWHFRGPRHPHRRELRRLPFAHEQPFRSHREVNMRSYTNLRSWRHVCHAIRFAMRFSHWIPRVKLSCEDLSTGEKSPVEGSGLEPGQTYGDP